MSVIFIVSCQYEFESIWHCLILSYLSYHIEIYGAIAKIFYNISCQKHPGIFFNIALSIYGSNHFKRILVWWKIHTQIHLCKCAYIYIYIHIKYIHIHLSFVLEWGTWVTSVVTSIFFSFEKHCAILDNRSLNGFPATRAIPQIAKFMGQYGAYLGPAGPRWSPCWPHVLCY